KLRDEAEDALHTAQENYAQAEAHFAAETAVLDQALGRAVFGPDPALIEAAAPTEPAEASAPPPAPVPPVPPVPPAPAPTPAPVASVEPEVEEAPTRSPFVRGSQ